MYEFDGRIRYSETDEKGKLTIAALLNYFQDCTVFHSESIRNGVGDLKDAHHAWMLTSWHVIFYDFPHLGDEVWIRTWPYRMRGCLGYRNFALDDSENRHLAIADTIWAYVDTESGRLDRIPEEMTIAYQLSDPGFGIKSERKLKAPAEYRDAGSLVVPEFFIDSNHHMNNNRYLTVAQDYLPADFTVQELQVEYRKEALAGDTMMIRVTEEENAITVNLTDQDGNTYAIVRFKNAGTSRIL